MGEVIATRAAYGKALVTFGGSDPDLIVLDADLAGATMTNSFAKAYPEKFFDIGIAEADMMGIAAGLATCGKKPFANSFAMFSAGRAYEQVRNSIAYPHLNVKVIGSHGGLSVGEDGATHQCIEDFALMRVIPGMTVLCPCDGNEMTAAVEALLNYDGPAYMRLGRLAVETVTDAIPGYRFEIGKGIQLVDGSDVTIIAIGMMVQEALKAAVTVDEGASYFGEEHNVIGGLGSAVSEFLSETCPTPVVKHGVNDVFGRSGKAPLVMKAYGLTPEGIAEKARAAIALKK